MRLEDELRERVEAIVGARVVGAYPPPGNGYTPARRVVVELEDGRRAFVKAALDEHIGGFIRDEIATYEWLSAPYAPDVLGWSTDGLPLLVLEDLSDARWPPPWDRDLVNRVLEGLALVAETPRPARVAALDEAVFRDCWAEVRRDPAPFLRTGFASPEWLDANIGTLCERSLAAPLSGDGLLHLDVRSDNLCQRADGSVAFVDWNFSCVGNPALDVACWLPSLAAEGGPEPDALLPDVDANLAVVVAGFFAARAGLPEIAKAPLVRHVQRQQLATALPWAARVAELPAPDLIGSDTA